MTDAAVEIIAKRRPGRPRRRPEDGRTYIGFKISPDLKSKLVHQAENDQTSISHIAERMIELGFVFKAMLKLTDDASVAVHARRVDERGSTPES
jgi:hypothetical protein